MKTEFDRLLNSEPGKSPTDPVVAELRDRISQLEAENAALLQSDHSLRRNARLFQALLRRSKDGIFLVTPQMTFLRMIHSIMGHGDEDALGQPVLTYIHPDDHGCFSDAFARLMSDPSKSVLCECRVRDQDGHWWWLELEMTDMLDDPDMQAIVFNSRNITQRKEYEEAIQKLRLPCTRCGQRLEF